MQNYSHLHPARADTEHPASWMFAAAKLQPRRPDLRITGVLKGFTRTPMTTLIHPAWLHVRFPKGWSSILYLTSPFNLANATTRIRNNSVVQNNAEKCIYNNDQFD